MANNRYRIDIPRDPTALLELLGKIKDKHTELGVASPLNAFKWDKIVPDFEEAAKQDKLSDQLHKAAQKATGERDKHLPELTEFVRAVRDVLTGLNRENPDALGDFGFSVADSVSNGGTATPAVSNK